MKTNNDFSKYLTDFLFKYLPGERGASSNTVAAYRDTFVLLIKYMETENNIKINKLALSHFNKNAIVNCLDWLQQDRKSSNATRNMRLAAIHSFFKYLLYEELSTFHECQKILSIKIKKQEVKSISYLSVDAIKLLLKQPDTRTIKGRRDLALLSLMYDTGARVQEVIDLTPEAIRLDKPQTVRIKGKGNKTRIIPMLEDQVKVLKNYMLEHGLNKPQANLYPLFCNGREEKLTRVGVSCILKKYVDMARAKDDPLMSTKVSCHSLRHSKAMHLLQAGVNLVYIRDILGHVSVTTTEIYARADSKQKRDAIEKAYEEVIPKEEAIWTNNQNLLDWLKRL